MMSRILLIIPWLLFNLFPAEDIEVKNTLQLEKMVVEQVNLKGMILPHHMVPLDQIQIMYERAESPSHILLISPDHMTSSNRHVLTTLKSWRVDNQVVHNNNELTHAFLNLPFVYEDDGEISREHGIYGHIPYIQVFYPEADLSVLAFSKMTTREEIDEILAIIPDDVFILASIDFSHYLTKSEAYQKDETTLRIMKERSWEDIFRLSDSYYDSPACLYLFLKYASKHNYELVVYDHKNSGDYLGDHLKETTSYFFIGLK